MGSKFQGSARQVRALDVFIKLARCTNVLDQRQQRELAELGMTVPQLAVLEALLHLGGLTQKQLGAKMLRSGGSVTSLIDGLERRGWVRRERGVEDRRVVHVHLTAKGRRRIEEVFPRHAAHIEQAMRALTASEQRELARLCKKLGLGQDPSGATGR